MRCRAVVICLLVLTVVGVANAQTPYTVGRVAGTASPLERKLAADAKKDLTAASAANPWMGAQLGYKFGNSDELGDNLLVSASVVHEIAMAKGRLFRLPVISNFADLVSSVSAETPEEESDDKLKELLLGSSGIRAGIYPYREVAGLHQDDFNFVLHGEASWKINGFKAEDSEEIDYVNQLRLAAGFEMAIGRSDDGHRPLTISITPVVTMFDPNEYEKVFKERKERQNTLEIVAVLPIATKTGVLFEFIRGDVQSFRAGVIVASAK
jgi:hypothetical protein